MSAKPIVHKMLPDGESTERWAFREAGFFGSARQIFDCARCGETMPRKRHDEPRHYRDLLKPTMHCLCDECCDALPE